MRAALILILLLTLAGLAYWSSMRPDTPSPATPPTALAEVTLPETLSANAQIGKKAFDTKCATCHGPNAAGQSGIAPPLIHKIYEPSHHADEAFQRAVSHGVRQHHWPFGNMPPVDGLTRADVTMIIAYIRQVQRANGIN